MAHGRIDVLVAQKSLHCSDIVVGLQEVVRRAMTQSVGADGLDDPRQAGGLYDRFLQASLGQVMAACEAGTRILGVDWPGKRIANPVPDRRGDTCAPPR